MAQAVARRQSCWRRSVLIVSMVGVAACGPRPDSVAAGTSVAPVTVTGSTMGTTYTVKAIRTEGEPLEATRLQSTVQRVLDGVDRAMSTWKPESEISRFNRHLSTDPFPISAAVADVIVLATRVSERSGGAFDVTVGPLVDAWGFGPQGEILTAPGPSELEAIASRVGFSKLVLLEDLVLGEDRDVVGAAARKLVPGLQIDLSGVAKGYAVDQVAGALERELALERFMVEVGGEVRSSGANAEGGPWRIAIEVPDSSRRALHAIVPLREQAMATSGDYRNYFEMGGERLSHTIDPRTGRPIRHHLASVSVVASDCASADAWATALLVLGEEGVALAGRLDLAALFLFRESDGSYRQESTLEFERLLQATEGRDYG